MPETSRTFANIEIKQGEDYELVITMDSTWVTTNKSWQCRIVKDFSGTTFTSADGAGQAYEEMTVAGDNSAKTITLSLTSAQTAGLPDDFEGYWDLVEKDTSPTPDSYTRQAEGEVIVFNAASVSTF